MPSPRAPEERLAHSRIGSGPRVAESLFRGREASWGEENRVGLKGREGDRHTKATASRERREKGEARELLVLVGVGGEGDNERRGGQAKEGGIWWQSESADRGGGGDRRELGGGTRMVLGFAGAGGGDRGWAAAGSRGVGCRSGGGGEARVGAGACAGLRAGEEGRERRVGMKRGKGARNGLLPSSLRIISSCLKTVTSNAGSVASTVRSAGASVAASISSPSEDEKDQVHCPAPALLVFKHFFVFIFTLLVQMTVGDGVC
jgi:hypothetical protein